tara:strand:- start:2333 stop:2884 length:552 start_codon:yes stop_codon:yes gene_type:complete
MTAKIKLNAASGGGSFSLQAPSSSSNDRVITLPDSADGTLITTTNRGQNVLQVVRNSTISTATTNSLSFADIPDCTLNITPSSSSNKYLATFSAYITTVLAGSHNQQTKIKILLDGNTISGQQNFAAESASGGLQWKGSANIRDFGTFGNTNQRTFKVQMAANRTESTVYIYNPTLIVMEFAA